MTAALLLLLLVILPSAATVPVAQPASLTAASMTGSALSGAREHRQGSTIPAQLERLRPSTVGSGKWVKLRSGAPLSAIAIPADAGPAQPGAVHTSLPPASAIGTVDISGLATWFAAPAGTAAAGPALRDALGSGWRNSVIRVSANGHTVTVTLSDWCQCRPRNGHETLIDLARASFARLADPSVGVIAVTIELGAGITLPQTDMATDTAP